MNRTSLIISNNIENLSLNNRLKTFTDYTDDLEEDYISSMRNINPLIGGSYETKVQILSYSDSESDIDEQLPNKLLNLELSTNNHTEWSLDKSKDHILDKSKTLEKTKKKKVKFSLDNNIMYEDESVQNIKSLIKSTKVNTFNDLYLKDV